MALYLVELKLTDPSAPNATAVIAQLEAVVGAGGDELIESQVTANHAQLFAIIEGEACANLKLDPAQLSGVSEVDGPHEVRLVGADLADIKAARPAAGYLVEWDIPAEITMEQYLARKAEKSPLYAQVPQVSFERTYVREDTAKCLCFYNAESADEVRVAREVVSTPISRLHELG